MPKITINETDYEGAIESVVVSEEVRWGRRFQNRQYQAVLHNGRKKLFESYQECAQYLMANQPKKK